MLGKKPVQCYTVGCCLEATWEKWISREQRVSCRGFDRLPWPIDFTNNIL